MVGIGIDAVDVDRFRRVLRRRPGLAERVFTEGERAYAAAAPDPAPRLAARFAAKEAVMKALGVGLGAVAFHDVEVLTDPTGAPRIAVDGRAARHAATLGVTAWRLSLTHTDRLAAAVAVAL